MIKKWADVVASCGESPRTLLAAAFASIQNIEMAQSLVPAEQVEGEIIGDGEICSYTLIYIKFYSYCFMQEKKQSTAFQKRTR